MCFYDKKQSVNTLFTGLILASNVEKQELVQPGTKTIAWFLWEEDKVSQRSKVIGYYESKRALFCGQCYE